MNRRELDLEIRETRHTLDHLVRIGEVTTAEMVSRYLDELIEQRDKTPDLRIVRHPSS